MPKPTKKSKEAPSAAPSTPAPSVPALSVQSTRLFQNLLKITEQFMSGKAYKPMTAEQLMERLSLPPMHAELFQHVLNTLVKQGNIELSHQKFIWKQNKADTVIGFLSVHPRGFGFLRPDDPTLFPDDIFIPKHLTMNAVDGDKVEVLINTEVVSEKGPEGKVTSIISRGRTHIAGIISQIEIYGDIIAYVPLLGSSQRVIVQPDSEYELKVGDRIVMEVLDWGSKETDTSTRMSHYIGHISDPKCDIPAAIEEFELRVDFPRKVVQEAEKYGNRVSLKEIAQREDLRKLECFTIDPDTAKDFDDAVSLTKDKKGHYHLGVHIADVSHYVKTGSPLDKEAKERCNSTYFPGYCLPMLPSVLSDNLCSLKPNVNRLTSSVLMEFDPDGNLVYHRMSRSVIKSCKRFTYKEAKKVLDGDLKSPHLPTLKLMVEMCALLKRKRYERGSIEFSMPELMVIVNSEGVPTGTDYIDTISLINLLKNSCSRQMKSLQLISLT